MALAKRNLKDFDDDLSDDEKEFFFAASETAELMKTLNDCGVSQTAAVSGALTQLLTQLFIGSRSQSYALGILASCLASASENAEKFEIVLGINQDEPPVH
jgi:hypothetical protein